jgi:Holliday junction DNA helicase RuvA
MIAHLRGRLLAKHPQQAIIEAGGVGYDVVISVTTFSALPAEGSEVSLFIHTHVREDTLALYGFVDREQKRVFERLITVSGVGPKLAVTIQSGLSTERLARFGGRTMPRFRRFPASANGLQNGWWWI